jgi:tRNA(adenine34) deaminase
VNPAASDLAAIRAALDAARDAHVLDEIPVGAVLLDPSGSIVARGHNERVAAHDPTAHAEVLALRRAGQALGSWNLAGCTLAVTLEPCAMCAGAIVNARIARVVFGAWDPKAGAMGSLWDLARDRRLNHRPEVIAGVLAEDCAALLDEFFAARRDAAAGGPEAAGSIELRPAAASDAQFLIEMTVLASDWRDAGGQTPDAVLADEHLRRYVADWGRPGDVGVVALDVGAAAAAPTGDVPVGAAWARVLPEDEAGYGFVAADIPELTIGVARGYRGRGIGGRLIDALVDALRDTGVAALSLSVEDGNDARHLYERKGFEAVGRDDGADTMLRAVSDPSSLR